MREESGDEIDAFVKNFLNEKNSHYNSGVYPPSKAEEISKKYRRDYEIENAKGVSQKYCDYTERHRREILQYVWIIFLSMITAMLTTLTIMSVVS